MTATKRAEELGINEALLTAAILYRYNVFNRGEKEFNFRRRHEPDAYQVLGVAKIDHSDRVMVFVRLLMTSTVLTDESVWVETYLEFRMLHGQRLLDDWCDDVYHIVDRMVLNSMAAATLAIRDNFYQLSPVESRLEHNDRALYPIFTNMLIERLINSDELDDRAWPPIVLGSEFALQPRDDIPGFIDAKPLHSGNGVITSVSYKTSGGSTTLFDEDYGDLNVDINSDTVRLISTPEVLGRRWTNEGPDELAE